MPRTGWTPSIVPGGADQTVYLVVDNFGALGTAYRETDVEQTDLQTVITDLISGQNTTIRFASSASTLPSVGRRMSQGMSPSKFKAAAISTVTMFRKPCGTLLIATPVLIGSWPCAWRWPCLGTVDLTSPFPFRADRLPARCAMSQITLRPCQS
jgi:hypothetical protein